MRTHIDLFTGIGGFTLAASANGVRTILFCESDRRCREFLARTWPEIPCWPDIRTLNWSERMADSECDGRKAGPPEGAIRCEPSERDTLCMADTGRIGSWENEQERNTEGRTIDRRPAPIWLLTGGVPCQPASRAGKHRGASDNRWLWPDALRCLGEIRPAWCLYENPPGIGDVGLDGILAQMEAQGYAVRVYSIPACAVGAPHRRERYWIVGHSVTQGHKERGVQCGVSTGEGHSDQWKAVDVADQGDMGNSESSDSKEGTERTRRSSYFETNLWNNYIWLSCSDGKLRRAPDDTFGLVNGLHRSVLGALGNSIVWPVAAEIIKAMILSEETEHAT